MFTPNKAINGDKSIIPILCGNMRTILKKGSVTSLIKADIFPLLGARPILNQDKITLAKIK